MVVGRIDMIIKRCYPGDIIQTTDKKTGKVNAPTKMLYCFDMSGLENNWKIELIKRPLSNWICNFFDWLFPTKTANIEEHFTHDTFMLINKARLH